MEGRGVRCDKEGEDKHEGADVHKVDKICVNKVISGKETLAFLQTTPHIKVFKRR